MAKFNILGPVQEDLIQESRDETNPQVPLPPDSRPCSTQMALHVIGIYRRTNPA
jgi:hypothetical protein